MTLTVMSLVLLVMGFTFLAISVVLAGKPEATHQRRKSARPAKRRKDIAVHKKAA